MPLFNELSSRSAPLPESSILTENDVPTGKGVPYIFDPAIDAAVDVAIGLGKPLLVAGEPGSGKTELGYAVARRMDIRTLYFFSVKSSSEAGDLFYTYDAIRRFRERSLRRSERKLRRTATSRSRSRKSATSLNTARSAAPFSMPISRRTSKPLLRGKSPPALPKNPRRSVVVIDEIDKAPRDFTNDLLREIEDISFRVPELQSEGVSDATLRREARFRHP
jgi:MoxR-like ATPase